MFAVNLQTMQIHCIFHFFARLIATQTFEVSYYITSDVNFMYLHAIQTPRQRANLMYIWCLLLT